MDIQFGLTEILTLVGGVVAAVASGVWFISHKFGMLETTLKALDKRLDDFHDRLITIEGKSNDIFKSQSPISLTEEGKRHLEKSGLKTFIDANIARFKEQRSILGGDETTYDIQESAFTFVDEYEFEPDFEKSLKTYAYENGVSMELLRRIGGIYFRDLSLENNDTAY